MLKGNSNGYSDSFKLTVRNFHFLGLTQAVILGVLLIDATVAVGNDGFKYLMNYRFICELTAVLIFVELYFVLNEYHIDLKVAYRTSYLFYDLFFIGLPFIVLIKLFQKSWNPSPGEPFNIDTQSFPKEAFGIFVYIFVAISTRQLVSFLMVPKIDPDTGKNIKKPKSLIVPMAADLIGIALFVMMYTLKDKDETTPVLGMNVEGMSYVAFSCLLIYFMVSRIVRIDFSRLHESMVILANIFKFR